MRFRVYDNGGESFDQYTIVFCDPKLAAQMLGEYPYFASSKDPFWPQGFGQHGGHTKPVDSNSDMAHRSSHELIDGYWVPKMGKRSHIGKRIRFRDLPPQVRKAAAMDYRAYYLTPGLDDDED